VVPGSLLYLVTLHLISLRFLKRAPSRMTVNYSTAIALSHYLSVKAIIAPWEAEEMGVPIL
jgi:hypothetical protein